MTVTDLLGENNFTDATNITCWRAQLRVVDVFCPALLTSSITFNLSLQLNDTISCEIRVVNRSVYRWLCSTLLFFFKMCAWHMHVVPLYGVLIEISFQKKSSLGSNYGEMYLITVLTILRKRWCPRLKSRKTFSDEGVYDSITFHMKRRYPV